MQNLPSHGAEGNNPTDISILDFQPPELYGHKFLLFKSPRVWCFVIAVLEN